MKQFTIQQQQVVEGIFQENRGSHLRFLLVLTTDKTAASHLSMDSVMKMFGHCPVLMWSAKFVHTSILNQ